MDSVHSRDPQTGAQCFGLTQKKSGILLKYYFNVNTGKLNC